MLIWASFSARSNVRHDRLDDHPVGIADAAVALEVPQSHDDLAHAARHGEVERRVGRDDGRGLLALHLSLGRGRRVVGRGEHRAVELLDLEHPVERRAEVGRRDVEPEPLAGRDRQEERILVPLRFDPPVQHDRRRGPGRRGLRIARLADFGIVVDGQRRHRLHVPRRAEPEHRPGEPRVEDFETSRRLGPRHAEPGLADRPAPQLEAGRLAPPAAERIDLVRDRKLSDNQPVDRPAAALIPRVGELDHVVAVLGQVGDDPGVGEQAGRVVGRGDVLVARVGPRQPELRVDRRADPGALGVDDDRAGPSCRGIGSSRRRRRPTSPRRRRARGSPGPPRTGCCPPPRAPAASWPTAKRNGFDRPSSVRTRTR